MRHNVYGRHLGRTKNQRTSLFRNLVGALILNGSIETTEAKAKAIKGLVDKIINQAKNKNSQRLVSQFLVHKNIQEKLFKEIIPVTKDRNSGFTSIVKLGQRLGDNTMKVRMSIISDELVVMSDESKKQTEEKPKRVRKTVSKKGNEK